MVPGTPRCFTPTQLIMGSVGAEWGLGQADVAAYGLGGRVQLDLRVSGSKNAALPVIAATLLVAGSPAPLVLHNIPVIADVLRMLEILQRIGGVVHAVDCHSQVDCTVTLSLADVRLEGRDVAANPAFRLLRGSYYYMGALLAAGIRRGEFPLPGGCPLGDRPVDFHMTALRALGAEVTAEGDRVFVSVPSTGLVASSVHFPRRTVGACINLILAATGARGITTITNCSPDPVVRELIRFLGVLGVQIRGDPTTTLLVTGAAAARPWPDVEFSLLPDPVVAATYATLAAALGESSVTISPVRLDTVDVFLRVLETFGCSVSPVGDGIRVDVRDLTAPRGQCFMTGEHPHVHTDTMALLVVLVSLSRASPVDEDPAGSPYFVFRDFVYPDRLSLSLQLNLLGANATMEDSPGGAVIVTPTGGLHAGTVACSDLRGCASFLIAALSGSRGSKVTLQRGYHHLSRGYPGTLLKLAKRMGLK
mmetsp:Transcript_4881/g.13682  ORF Transcript_4881/g.13682 Transcript_4881/m.13682 type:complete len:478 (+) Transcript_4881:2-1435(+)